MNPSSTSPIQTLLIANRGEIACRIMRTAKRLGIRTVAVYSDADKHALHVASADTAVCIGTAMPAQSYLNSAAIISAAKDSGADAIHPGYGFLSENPEFVDACDQAGLLFVGPSSAAMRAMGLKDAAKALMEKAGVPVVPGYHGSNQDIEFLAAEAQRIGYPVLIKARAGGGGKGMRMVEAAADFAGSLQSAQREAGQSFGDSAVLIEKFVLSPRHIEVQVFADKHGNTVHLFERDCSLQRRHQKVIEEAPAPAMTPQMRTAMTDAAIRCAKAVDYVGAGTVEFIVDGSGELHADGFWFMEMNTRLQVEHPVTELVTGTDLVEWQLRVAAGEVLPLQQQEIFLQGHAIEARLYAEDANAGFLPATGTVETLRLPEQGRVDSGIREGDEVQPYYDPLLAKLIAVAADRKQAISKLAGMLDNTVLLGTTSNREFLANLCRHWRVQNGDLDTALIAEHIAELTAPALQSQKKARAVVAVMLVTGSLGSGSEKWLNSSPFFHHRPGQRLWQQWGDPVRRVSLLTGEQLVELAIRREADGVYCVESGDAEAVELSIGEYRESGIRVGIQGMDTVAHVVMLRCAVAIQLDGRQHVFSLPQPWVDSGQASAQGHLQAPMPGRIVAVKCAGGDSVEAGDALVIMEAMKMEHTLTAAVDGTVESVQAGPDDQVQQGEVLVRFKH